MALTLEKLKASTRAEVRPLRLMLLTPIQKRIDNRRHRMTRNSSLPRLTKQLPVLSKGRVFIRPQVVLNPVQRDVPQPA